MSFQLRGGWVDEEEGVGLDGGGSEGRRGGVIAPDAHTPTPTNYYCVVENEDEEETEAPQTQMSRFVRFRPQRQIKNREGGQVTSYVSPSGKLRPRLLVCWAPQPAPFGSHMDPIM